MTKINGVLPLDAGEYVLATKDRGDHNLIVTNKRLFVEQDGEIKPVVPQEMFSEG